MDGLKDGAVPSSTFHIQLSSFEKALIDSGFRNVILSGYASKDYAERCHDEFDNGATIGLRCSESVNQPYRFCFLYPTISCWEQKGIIVTQPFGTLTSWLANGCEHTGSVDAIEFYDRVEEHLRVPSVGIVGAPGKKLLSSSSKKKRRLGERIYDERTRT